MRPSQCHMQADRKKFKKCAGCGVVLYCSEKCEKDDWPRHGMDCKIAGGEIGALFVAYFEKRSDAHPCRKMLLWVIQQSLKASSIAASTSILVQHSFPCTKTEYPRRLPWDTPPPRLRPF